MTAYVTLEGYVIAKTTDAAVAVRRLRDGPIGRWTWLPRSACQDGDLLEVEGRDVCVRENLAIEKGLKY